MPTGGTDACLTFDIDTTGQWVTASERRFWEAECDTLIATAQDGPGADVHAAPARATQRSLWQNLAAGALIVIVMFACSFGARMAFASQFAGWIGLGAGAAISTLIVVRWLGITFR